MSATVTSSLRATAPAPNAHPAKAVSARNATTHGLFARDIVLPTLGEDPEGFQQIQAELCAQLQPENLLEQHYVEKIAAASWRLRRLHRWQAQLFEDRALTEDARLDRLDKVLRHETHLHRQIDSAVKMLNRDVPQLHQSRARRHALANTQKFEAECRADREADLEVTVEARRLMQPLTAAPALDAAKFDAVPTALEEEERAAAEKCRNEPPPWLVARREQEQRERTRILATLAHDVSDVLPDGRPAYLSLHSWEYMQARCAKGYVQEAAEYGAYDRARFLEDQTAARAILAAEAPPEAAPERLPSLTLP